MTSVLTVQVRSRYNVRDLCVKIGAASAGVMLQQAPLTEGMPDMQRCNLLLITLSAIPGDKDIWGLSLHKASLRVGDT